MKRAAFALINLKHLKNNLATIRKVAPQSKVMAVVKADAYGHGMLSVCNTLNEVDAFSVAYINEAMDLRENGIQKPIVVLQGFAGVRDLELAIAQNIQVVIHHEEQIKILKSLHSPLTLDVSVKIDTGMHRLGFATNQVNEALEEIRSQLLPDSKISLMTHLACADEVNNPATSHQLDEFDRVVKGLDFEQSIANSAGILAWPQTHRNWVRPGLVLYGVNPIEDSKISASVDLKPVMSIHAPVISIKHCKKGEKIGYGGDFCCPHDMVIGIIAVGYADGYPRHLKHMPYVSLNKQRTRILGRVSMDMIVVDLEGIETHIGDIAELWGEQVPVSEVARYAETISYELLCTAGNSLEKKYI